MLTTAVPEPRHKEVSRVLILLLTLLPLCFFPNLINLYRLPKETLLAFLTAVLCWLWLLDSVRRSRSNNMTVLPLIWPLSFYVGLSALSLINAVNLYEGARHIFNLVVGISLFWIIANYVKPTAVQSLFRWIAIAGGVVALVGIAQAFGAEIPGLIQVAVPSSTFGNKNSAAQYLLFVLPVSYYLLFLSSEPRKEWLYGILAALISTYLLYTGTRAAWGASLISLLALWCSLRAKGFTPQELLSFSTRKRCFLFGIFVFVASMKTIPPYFIPNFAARPTIAGVQSMLELETDRSAQARFAIWANTLAMFKDHPLVGVGKGNFQFFYPLYNRSVIEDPSFSVELKAGEAHNDYVQLLAEVGLLGTAAFLWIAAVLALRFWRGLQENFNPMILPIGFALTAILLEAFWDFPFAHPTPTAFFWIYSGVLWGLTQSDRPQDKQASGRLAVVITCVLAVSTTAASALALMHLRAEFYYSRALFGEYQVKNIEEKLDWAGKDLDAAVRIFPFDYRYHHWRAVLLMRKGNAGEALQANLRALRLNPYHINTINNLGVIYEALGNVPKSIQAFETALMMWPGYVGARNNLAQLHEKAGDKEKAIEEFRKTLRIDPKNKIAREKLAELLKLDSL